ncbi:MAG: hypothetical protein AAFY72_10110, partial [Cyanobacteria bacterium J06649_4]
MNIDHHRTLIPNALGASPLTVFKRLNDPVTINALVKRTREWTSGHPFLTTLIYSYAAKYSAQIVAD